MSATQQQTAEPLLAYFGHHKCATQWMNRIIQKLCVAIGHDQFRYANQREFGGDLSKAHNDSGSVFVRYVNAGYRAVKNVSNMRSFHMVRDPRDVLVSAYFSHLNTHPTDEWPPLEAHREKLRHLNTRDGLLAELNWRSTQFRLVTEWPYDHPDILEIRMEDATSDTDTVLRHVAEHLGILGTGQLGEKRLANVATRSSFSKIAGTETRRGGPQ